MTDMIAEAAALIRQFDPALADRFVSRPFHRVAYARAFMAGLSGELDSLNDRIGLLVFRVAWADSQSRALGAAE